SQSPRTKAFKVELNAHVASMLIGPGAERLKEIEKVTKRVFVIEGKEGAPLDHLDVLDKGTVEKLVSTGPYKEGQELDVKLGEVGLHDSDAGMGKLDGYDVCVGGASRLVGKKVKARVERVMDGTIYASLAGGPASTEPPPITAEGLAEKPTRGRKGAEPAAKPEAGPSAEVEVAEPEVEDDTEETPEPAAPKKKTRRGSRGGRRRRKPAAATAENGAGPEDAAAPRIHLPDPALGSESEEEPVENGAQPARRRRSRPRGKPATAVVEEAQTETPQPEPEAETPAEGEAPKRKKKTRRGSRGGRRRKKATTATETPSES